MPYILITTDGQYVVQSQTSTHTGQHNRLYREENINKATLFYGLIGTVFKRAEGGLTEKDVTQLEAKEIRRIEIVPQGASS